MRARVWTLAAAGIAALAATSAIALGASPRHGAGQHAHNAQAHARACAHARGHPRLLRRLHCRHASHKGASVHHSPSSAGGSTPSSGGVSSPGGTPAPGAAPPAEEGAPSAPGQEPPSVPHVQVSAVEFRYTLSRSRVPAGKVIIEFIDSGQDEHNLNLSSNEELQVSFPTAQPKAVSDQSVILKKGTYTLFCSLPEHENKGMKATLTVE